MCQEASICLGHIFTGSVDARDHMCSYALFQQPILHSALAFMLSHCKLHSHGQMKKLGLSGLVCADRILCNGNALQF